jgi:hypothetical protein
MRVSLLLPSALLLACTGIAPASSARRPHLVIALADDLGWNDLEGFGGGNRMQSPQISDLAAEGIRLTSWCVSPFSVFYACRVIFAFGAATVAFSQVRV